MQRYFFETQRKWIYCENWIL